MNTNLQERQQEVPAGPPVKRSPSSFVRILAIVALVVLIALGGIYAFKTLTKDEPTTSINTEIDPSGKWFYLDAESFTVSTLGLDSSGSLLADIYWGDEARTVTHRGSWTDEDGVVQLTLDNGITEMWVLGRDASGNEILTYRDSSAPEKTASLPGTIAYRSQVLMEKNK